MVVPDCIPPVLVAFMGKRSKEVIGVAAVRRAKADEMRKDEVCFIVAVWIEICDCMFSIEIGDIECHGYLRAKHHLYT
jgi:hypothetical protein